MSKERENETPLGDAPRNLQSTYRTYSAYINRSQTFHDAFLKRLAKERQHGRIDHEHNEEYKSEYSRKYKTEDLSEYNRPYKEYNRPFKDNRTFKTDHRGTYEEHSQRSEHRRTHGCTAAPSSGKTVRFERKGRISRKTGHRRRGRRSQRQDNLPSETNDFRQLEFSGTQNPEGVELGAKEMELGAKEMELGAKEMVLKPKDLELGAKDLELGFKSVELDPTKMDPKEMVLDPIDMELSTKDMKLDPKEMVLDPKDMEFDPKDMEFDPKDMELDPKDMELDPTPMYEDILGMDRGSGDKNQILSHILNSEDLSKVSQPLCRTVMGRYLPPDLFSLDACALCYHYMQNEELFVAKWRREAVNSKRKEGSLDFHFTIFLLSHPNATHTIMAEVDSPALLSSFRGEAGRNKWKTCCQAAQHCCQHMLKQNWPQGKCPNTWDGWQCWDTAFPDTIVNRPCPAYSYYDKEPSCTKEASKKCEMNGEWYKLEGGKEWSNYSSCSIHENIRLRLYVHIAAYSVSIAALLPALCIFFSYKQLRVHRITLHKHLFLSLLLEAAGSIVQRSLQLSHDTIMELLAQSPSWCVMLTLLTKYTMLSTYMWYLNEGFYLHKLLASAFAEQNNLIIFYIIGWGFPLVPLTAYSLARELGGYHNTHCWLIPQNQLEWIIYTTALLALLINIVFLVNIIRILVSKVRAQRGAEPSQYRKAVRATLMVVPLFGLQYVVTIYRHQELGCDWHDLYQICNNVIEGSRGAVVALIFCYTNGEVKTVIRRWWVRLGERRAPGGSVTCRSRSLSTMHTTLLHGGTTRRKSSIVSITPNYFHRRSNSMATTSLVLHSTRGSKNSINNTILDSTSPQVQRGASECHEAEWRVSRTHSHGSRSTSKSPSLRGVSEKDELELQGHISHSPLVVYKGDGVEPRVELGINAKIKEMQ